MKGGLIFTLAPLVFADEKAIARLAVIMARKGYNVRTSFCNNEVFTIGESLRDCSEEDPCWAIGDSTTECGECYSLTKDNESPIFVQIKDVTEEGGAKFLLPEYVWNRGCPYACIDDDVCVSDPAECTTKGLEAHKKSQLDVMIHRFDCPITKRRLQSNEGRGKWCSTSPDSHAAGNDLPPLSAGGCSDGAAVAGGSASGNGLPPLPKGNCSQTQSGNNGLPPLPQGGCPTSSIEIPACGNNGLPALPSVGCPVSAC